MIHYHGTPLSPTRVAIRFFTGRHAMISFRHPEQVDLLAPVVQTYVVDNGAFSAWATGEPITDWQPYYKWVDDQKHHPAFEWGIIPDVINGTEDDNLALIRQWPHEKHFGVPVWHANESLDFLKLLVGEWPRVCIGSSDEFQVIGAKKWWDRISRAMDVICDASGYPKAKLHGLRMLSGKIVKKLPLNSADSTNVSLHYRDVMKRDKIPGLAAAEILGMRVENVPTAEKWEGMTQLTFPGTTESPNDKDGY